MLSRGTGDQTLKGDGADLRSSFLRILVQSGLISARTLKREWVISIDDAAARNSILQITGRKRSAVAIRLRFVKIERQTHGSEARARTAA